MPGIVTQNNANLTLEYRKKSKFNSLLDLPGRGVSELGKIPYFFLSSPVPKPPRPLPNQVQPSSKPKLVSSGLGLTLKSCRPPPPPTTFKHLGGVPQKVSKSKKVSEWSSLLCHKKNLLDSGRKDKGLSTMFKEDIIKLTCCTIINKTRSGQ